MVEVNQGATLFDLIRPGIEQLTSTFGTSMTRIAMLARVYTPGRASKARQVEG